jgi:GNAT superfamily N-acetyltransferase
MDAAIAQPVVLVRHGTSADYPLVFDAILRGLCDNPTHAYAHRGGEARYGGASPITKHVSRAVVFHEYRRVLEDVLKRAVLLVAESDGALLGFALMEKPPHAVRTVAHYVYVKASFRRQGIAKQLLAMFGSPDEWEVSHLREETWGWISKRWPGARYNPFRVWPRS